ncbi:hypothetical protein BTHI11S_02081 [Bosea thiooxidans]
MDQRRLRLAIGFHVDLAPSDHRAHRRLGAAERLGERRHIRHDAVTLEGEELAGAAEPALHLVGNPEHAVLVAECAQLAPEAFRRLDDAAAALDRLHHHDADRRIALQREANRLDIAEGHLDPVLDQLELRLVERRIRDREHALGLAVERVRGMQDLRLRRPLRLLGHLQRRLHRLRAGGAEEDHVEIARRDGGEVLRQRRRILRHERHADLVAVLVLELLPRGDDARMVVPEGDRAEAAEEIEDPAAVPGDVVHALGAIDEDPVEAEQLQEMQLAGVEMRGEELLHLAGVELLGGLDADELRAGAGHGGILGLEGGHAHAARLLGAGFWPSLALRYSV